MFYLGHDDIKMLPNKNIILKTRKKEKEKARHEQIPIKMSCKF